MDLGRFAPPPGDPDRPGTLCELVRIDLEHGWTRGTPKPLAAYRAEFPDLFARPDLAEAVEFEDSRLRDHHELTRTAARPAGIDRTAVVARYQAYGQLVRQVNSLRSQVDSERERLDRLRASGRIGEYNGQVDGYNALVRRYNGLADRYNLVGE